MARSIATVTGVGKARQRERRLVEVVTNLPKELVIPHGYARIPDLIRCVQRKLGSDLDDGTGVHVPNSLVPRVPLGRQRQAITYSLLECKLSASPVGDRHNVSRKVESPKSDASPVLPLLCKGCVKVVSHIVGPLADREK